MTQCTGISVLVGGAVILCKSSKQKNVATSATHCEILALYESIGYISSIRNLLMELGYKQQGPAKVQQDNRGAISIYEKGWSYSNKSRHIRSKYFYVMEQIADKMIQIAPTPTEEMISDGLTKPLGGGAFRESVARGVLQPHNQGVVYTSSSCNTAAAERSMTERLLQSGGIDRTIRYYEYPSKDIQSNHNQGIKNYLICCPGWLCSPVTMGDNLSEISNFTKYTLIVIEWRGHGNSQVFYTDHVTISLLAEDLRSLVLSLKSSASQISLLGHSMGVNVIWRYIEKFGESDINRHIFLDQPAAITGSVFGERIGYKKEWRIHSKSEVYILAFLCLLKNFLVIPILQNAFSAPWMRGKFLAYAKKCNSVACARLLIDTTFTDNTQRVSLVYRPCLIYGGDASFVNPDVQRWIAQRVRGPVQLLIYPKPYGTHFPFYPVESDVINYGPSRLVTDISEYLLSNTLSITSNRENNH